MLILQSHSLRRCGDGFQKLSTSQLLLLGELALRILRGQNKKHQDIPMRENPYLTPPTSALTRLLTMIQLVTDGNSILIGTPPS